MQPVSFPVHPASVFFPRTPINPGNLAIPAIHPSTTCTAVPFDWVQRRVNWASNPIGGIPVISLCVLLHRSPFHLDRSHAPGKLFARPYHTITRCWQCVLSEENHMEAPDLSHLLCVCSPCYHHPNHHPSRLSLHNDRYGEDIQIPREWYRHGEFREMSKRGTLEKGL